MPGRGRYLGGGGGSDGNHDGDEQAGRDELGRIEEAFGADSPLSESALERDLPRENLAHDRYDSRLWRELTGASEELGKLLEDEEAPRTFPSLVNDLFLAYFKAQPDLLPEEGVHPAPRKVNRPFVQRTLEDPDTYRARAATRLDAVSSGLAALAASEKLLEEIKSRRPLRDFFEQGYEPKEELEGMEPEGNPSPTPGDEADSSDGGGSSEGAPEGGAPESGDPEPDPEEGPGERGEELPLPGRDARRAVRSASRAGRDEADRISDALSGWGLSPADLAKVPLGERLDLLGRLSAKEMTSLLDLVGRMRSLARQKARESVRERIDEIHSIEPTGDLARLLPSELAALASGVPERRLEAEARFIEGRSLGWRLKEKPADRRGPVIAMLDSSASMDGERMEWATAVALGAVDLASGRGGLPKRPSCVLFFNERVVGETRFAPGERDARKLLSVATAGAGGGTDYEPPLTRAMEVAGESDYDGADLLLVTDALCRLSDEFLGRLVAEKTRRGTRLYSVLIGARSAGELECYSERVFTLEDLKSAAPAREVAGEIFSGL